MLLTILLVAVGGLTLGALAVLLLVCVGRSRRRMPLDRRSQFVARLRKASPYIAGLTFVLLVNKGLQRQIERFSRAYGVEAGDWFYSVEGAFVPWFQQLFPEVGVLYFSPIYVVGYVVLLVFPLVAYLVADTLRPLRTLLVAYAINYAVAVVCYATVYAYGPRNYGDGSSDAASADAPMLELFPEITVLTAQVNVNTNVFPSLHTALSVTVMALAVSTHDQFPRWTAVAVALGSSIVAATMYLGIHWLIDVVAGVILGLGSVLLARSIVSRIETSRVE